MCWIFADTWLEDPEKEATRQTKSELVSEYTSAHPRRKKTRRYVVVKPGDDRTVEGIEKQEPNNVWEYIPAASEKKSSKASKKGKSKRNEEGANTKKNNDNTWEYIPAEPSKASKKSSKKSSKHHDDPCVATGSVGGEYEHWPDDETQVSASSASASVHSSKDGAREWQYQPANDKKAAAPIQLVPYAYQPPTNAAPQYQYMTSYPPMQYAYPPQMAYPAPAYYGYPMAGNNQAGGGYCPPGYTPVYAPAPAPAVEEKPKKKQKKSPRKWQGRTKAEVEEDNMKIAQREGAYAARKVEPVGLKEDQMVWVVEVDGTHTLRTYATTKEFKGEWKADPRFKDSWYFVREKEEEKKCEC